MQGIPSNSLKYYYYKQPVLFSLIAVNIGVFLIYNLINLFCFLYKIPADINLCGHAISRMSANFAIPSNLVNIGNRPWTIITYMFYHEQLLHLLFNMLMLYFGGIIFSEYLSNKKLVYVYLFGGVVGAAFYVISFNIFPAFADVTACSIAMGASASVLAVFIAAATYIPDLTVSLFLVGKIKLKYIAILFIVIDIFSIEKENPGGHLAHLGGALFGFLYVIAIKSSKQKSIIPISISTALKNLFKRKSRIKAQYNPKPRSDEEYNRIRAEKQKRTDVILDKISKAGYESLTKEEKEFLFKMSDRT